MSDREEWRNAVNASTELDLDLAVQEPRRAIGITGDKDDDQ